MLMYAMYVENGESHRECNPPTERQSAEYMKGICPFMLQCWSENRKF